MLFGFFPLGVPGGSVVSLVLSLTVSAMRAPVHVSKVDLVVFGRVGFLWLAMTLVSFSSRFFMVFSWRTSVPCGMACTMFLGRCRSERGMSC